jgi:hypothetical protein
MRKVAPHIGLICAFLTLVFSFAVRAETFSLREAPRVGADERSGPLESLGESPAFLGAGEYDGSDEIPKSKSKAFLYSLLLPGWGHYYVGDKKGAAAFGAVEAATWTSFVVFEVQGYLREEGYEDFAGVFAGISSSGHSDDYYAIIAEYDSWVEYEEAVKSEGRFAIYPDAGAAALEKYFVENRVSDYEAWEWESADIRRDFRSNRSSSKTSYRRALYAVAVAAANRVASAFFALKATNDANRALEERRVGYHLEFGAPVYHTGAGLQTGVSFVASF